MCEQNCQQTVVTQTGNCESFSALYCPGFEPKVAEYVLAQNTPSEDVEEE